MLTRKSGILALVVGALVLGACENKAPNVTINQPTPPISITISPNPVPQLKKGQTVQLVAAVQNTTNTAVTWSVTSGTTVVSVSATGLVTANNPGTATVQAVSAADANVKAAVAISVADTTTTGGGQPTVGQPSITIGSVTQGGTQNPVNPGNVAGTVDVTLNVDIPTGVKATALRLVATGPGGASVTIPCQSFSSTGSEQLSVEGAQAPQTVVCSVPTAQIGANGVPTFLNGQWTFRTELLNGTTVIANATTQPLLFNNTDVINAVVTTTKGPAADQNSLSWRGGDVVVTLTPSIYSGAANNVSSVTVTATNSSAAAIEGGAASCATTGRALPLGGCASSSVMLTGSTATNGAYTVTFPASAKWSAGTGVGGIEDPDMTFNISGLTASGQNFGGNTNLVFNNNALSNNGFGGGSNQLRLDNLAPRVTLLDITPATLACAPNAACYVNGSFALTTSAYTYSSSPTSPSGFSRTVDYGVDKQTISFAAGTSSSSLTTFTSVNSLPETAVANTDVLQATVTDALQNSRSVYATDVNTCLTASSTSVSAANQQPGSPSCVGVTTVQKFGVDLTPPTIAASGNGQGVATAPAPLAANTFTFTASDAGVGPSAIKQFNVVVEKITPSGTTCLNPNNNPASGTVANCAATVMVAAGNPAAVTVTLPDASAYYRITATAQDYAGNTSTSSVQVQLRDFVPPTVGGMATPSSITGNTSVSFSAPMSDDVELGDIMPTILYTQNAVNTYLANPRRQIGTYGFDVFSNSDAGTFTVDQFIRSIELTTAGGLPSGTISLATTAQADVRDVAGVQLADVCPVATAGDGVATQNCYQREGGILAAVAFGMNNAAETSWAAAGRPFGTGTNNQGTFFGMTTSTGAVPAANTNVCSNNPVGANSGCNVVTTTSITLYAQALGPSQTFAAPFARLAMYAVDPVTGRSFKVCDAGAPGAVDNTVNNTRTWTYSCTWTPTASSPVPSAAGVYQTFALGVDGSGRALKSQNRQVTLTSD